MADQTGGPWRMQADQRVKLVLQNHHHIYMAQQLAQHDAFVYTLAPAQRIARISNLFPVLKGCALIIAPELRAGIE
jgi:hypothetical protein